MSTPNRTAPVCLASRVERADKAKSAFMATLNYPNFTIALAVLDNALERAFAVRG